MKKKHFYAAVILLGFLAAGIQPALAIIYLSNSGWSDPTVGGWDSVTLTGTLTQDVFETIQIMDDGITLDGAGLYKVTASDYQGILLWYVNNVTVKNVTVENFEYGIYLSYSNDNIIYNNTLWNNGIEQNNAGGIGTNHAYRNIIKNNTISSNYNGIVLSASSNDNQIYNNNFFDNTANSQNKQARVIGSSGNLFNLGLPTGGNHWNDHTGPDENPTDGIVDNPYEILNEFGHTIAQDNLPWTVPNGWSNHPPIADAGPDQIVEQDSYAGASVTLDGSDSSDPDGDPLTYTWAWDSSSASGVNPTVTLPLGTTTVTLTAYDGELSDTDTVDITVQSAESPAAAVEYIRDYIEQMDVPEDAEKEMGKAVKELNKAIDEFNKDRIDKAIKKITKAVKRLQKAQEKGADTQDVIDKLVDLVQGL